VRPPQVDVEGEAVEPVALTGRPEIRPILIGDHPLPKIGADDFHDHTPLRGRTVTDPAAETMIVEVID
jgi:hypothetical protein